jgi:hypothetical protein
MIINWIWFLNGLSLAALSVICFYGFLVWYLKKHTSIIGNLIGISGIVFFFYSLINIIWSFGTINPYKSDFIFIGGVFNVAIASLVLVIIYNLVRDKNLLYLLFLFLFNVFAMPSNINMFFSILSFVSFSIIAIASFDLFRLSKKPMSQAGMFSLLFSLSSILILIIFKNNLSAITWFIPNILLFIVFFLLVEDIEKWGSKQKMPKKQRREVSYPFLFAKFVVFISLITMFAILSTVVLHEVGHALAGQYYGCERNKAVIYDISDLPHTEMLCRGYHNETIITLSGIFLPIIIALIFLLTGTAFTKNLSYMIFGFSMVIPSLDLKSIGFSDSRIFIIIISGFAVILYSVVKTSVDYVKNRGGLFNDEKKMNALSNPSHFFWIDEDTPVKDLYQFLDKINCMSNNEFKSIIEKRKFDLYEWLNDVLKEKQLACEFKKINSKKQAKIILIKHLMKKEQEEENEG